MQNTVLVRVFSERRDNLPLLLVVSLAGQDRRNLTARLNDSIMLRLRRSEVEDVRFGRYERIRETRIGIGELDLLFGDIEPVCFCV